MYVCVCVFVCVYQDRQRYKLDTREKWTRYESYTYANLYVKRINDPKIKI